MASIERALDADNHIGESPVWIPSEQSLWWVNCEAEPAIFRWHPASGERKSWPMPSRVGGLVPKAHGGLLLALADGVYDFDPRTGALALRARADIAPHVTLHECQCDRQGRFWVGAFDHRFPADREAADGAWFRLDGNSLTPVLGGVSVANGLAFSPDGRTIYTANTPRRIVEAFDLDPATGALANGRTFLTLAAGDGHIDGATVDAEGGYWLAVVGRGSLRRFLPDGTLDREVSLPCSNPTKAAFGGPALGTLYVTSTKLQIAPDWPGAESNGAIFSFLPGVSGIAETPFIG